MADVTETCYTELYLGLGTKSKSRRHSSSSLIKDSQNNKNSFIVNFGLSCTFDRDLDQPSLAATDRHSVDSNSDSEDSSRRKKKLRLTEEQSTLLEQCFKLQTTLIPLQKQSLADKLNLKPRQVEVWFQNRRARNKLKQTEKDCERLKRCCETLTKENRKLKKQLDELKSSYKFGPFTIVDVQSLKSTPSAYNAILCSLCKKNIGSNESIMS